MHGRVRFSIGMAVVTTTDREFRVNLPHRRLLCAVRGAAKTPQNAEAKPSTAVGRPTEPTGPMPAERDGPCTCEVGVWVSRRNGRAGRRAERERDKGNRDRDRRCRADAPTAARRCLAASAPRLLCCGDQITSFRGGSKAHAFTAKAKNVSAMSGEVAAKLSTCWAGKPTDFLSNPGQQPLNLGVARKPAPATAHARAWASTKTFLVVRRRQPPVTRPATSMDVTSDSWLLLRVEGGAHVAAPPPRQSAGPAPTRGDAHMRHPSWGPISVKSQNLVHKSEFWSLDAATSRA